MEIDKIKLRPSMMGNLFTAKEWTSGVIAPLAHTAKAELCKILACAYGRVEEMSTPAMRKGTLAEDDSISLVNFVELSNYKKNSVKFSNEFIAGTPDIITPDGIIDIKTSWSLRTFLNAKVKNDNLLYIIQLHCYCWLVDRDEASLIYCLTNTPMDIVADEIRRASFGKSDEDIQLIESQIIRNHFYDDIQCEQRIHKVIVNIDQSKFLLIKEKVEQCRIFLKTII